MARSGDPTSGHGEMSAGLCASACRVWLRMGACVQIEKEVGACEQLRVVAALNDFTERPRFVRLRGS